MRQEYSMVVLSRRLRDGHLSRREALGDHSSTEKSAGTWRMPELTTKIRPAHKIEGAGMCYRVFV